MNIEIDFRRDRYLSEFSIKTLQDRYLVGGEGSPQQAFARAAEAFADNEAHAQRLYDYASKLWFMFSTPILVMEAQNEVYLLVVFLTTWMTVDWVSLAITQRTHFYPPWAVGLVATGVTLGVWALKPVTVQNLLVLSLL